MNWAVRTIVMQTGERLPVLVPKACRCPPNSEVLTYTIGQLRGSSAVNTMLSKLGAIGRGLQFCADRDIVILERAAAGEFLADAELTGWAMAARQRLDGGGTVDTIIAGTSYQAFIEFFEWSCIPVISRIRDDKRRLDVRLEFAAFLRRAQAKRPRSQGPTEPGQRVDERGGLTPEARALFVAAITPGNALNPFRPCDQHRIYPLLLTAFSLGPRTGELLGCKTKDFNQKTSPATLTLHRRHDDPEDTRAVQPVAKTHGRVLPLDDRVRDALHAWISGHRSDRRRQPLARKHPFIFTNNTGAPLGISGYQERLRFLRSRVPGLAGVVNHMLRHDSNERFVAAGFQAGRSAQEIAEDQCELNGWSYGSRMPQRYAKQVLRQRAKKQSLDSQRSAFDGRYK